MFFVCTKLIVWKFHSYRDILQTDAITLRPKASVVLTTSVEEWELKAEAKVEENIDADDETEDSNENIDKK